MLWDDVSVATVQVAPILLCRISLSSLSLCLWDLQFTENLNSVLKILKVDRLVCVMIVESWNIAHWQPNHLQLSLFLFLDFYNSSISNKAYDYQVKSVKLINLSNQEPPLSQKLRKSLVIYLRHITIDFPAFL